MKRLTVNLGVALLSFCLGMLIWLANPERLMQAHPSEPLRVTLSRERQSASSKVTFDHYTVTVQNVSSKTIHGYSLGQTCSCLGQGTYGPYPDGISFSNPNPERQLLKPGDFQTQVIFDDGLPVDQLRVWADLVHFTDGTNWGPNDSRTEGYVRALE